MIIKEKSMRISPILFFKEGGYKNDDRRIWRIKKFSSAVILILVEDEFVIADISVGYFIV